MEKAVFPTTKPNARSRSTEPSDTSRGPPRMRLRQSFSSLNQVTAGYADNTDKGGFDILVIRLTCFVLTGGSRERRDWASCPLLPLRPPVKPGWWSGCSPQANLFIPRAVLERWPHCYSCGYAALGYPRARKFSRHGSMAIQRPGLSRYPHERVCSSGRSCSFSSGFFSRKYRSVQSFGKSAIG